MPGIVLRIIQIIILPATFLAGFIFVVCISQTQVGREAESHALVSVIGKEEAMSPPGQRLWRLCVTTAHAAVSLLFCKRKDSPRRLINVKCPYCNQVSGDIWQVKQMTE